MIELRDLQGGYRGWVCLHSLNLRFPAGRVSTIVGPNGCGKSTLLKTAARRCPPFPARCWWTGGRSGITAGWNLPAGSACFPRPGACPLSGWSSLSGTAGSPIWAWSRSPGERDRMMVEQALERTGLQDLRGRDLRRLSGGERQRAYLAMLIAQDADVMLLDEPTTYLDVGQQYEILSLIRALNAGGKTVVMVLHDLALAMKFSDAVFVLERGELADWGEPGAVFARGTLQRVFGVQAYQVETGGGTEYIFAGQTPPVEA